VSEPVASPGLYIHIPFCRSKCGYCDFYSEPSLDRLPLFLQALPVEMKLYAGSFETFDTVYIGGGTPSLLRPDELDLIFRAMHRHLDVSAESEITLEANPADLQPAYLRSLLALGVNRLNIGVQSFHPADLDFLGRRHPVQDARRAIDDARKTGFDNIGLDLIYGLPGMDMSRWTENLKTALSFEPEHLSCYELSLSPQTPLGRALQRKVFTLPEEHHSFRLFIETADLLEASGFVHYEVSNFARGASRVSRHNLKYWDHSPYLGLGPAAHSYLNRERWWNHQCVAGYVSDLGKGKKPVDGRERLSPEDLILETLFLGFRTRKGVHLGSLRKRTGLDLEKEKGDALRRLEAGGYLLFRDGRLIPTRRGYAVADRLPLML
jgi:oxygen-independent coproporphyrinogen-3 oxidase